MEHFIVSARKYRPQVFDDVVGQKAITNTLENAIKNNHLAQALLFTGPRGVGKTTCARILAKRINQANVDKIDPDEDFAFNIFELDAASNNSVDDIRNLTDQVRIPPQTGKYKVYIIDEVHMLSQAAFNAFLKTLEEPPAHAIFILATTEKHKIIPTILSRCQIFDFKRIGVVDIKDYLHKIAKEENIKADDDALHIVAQKADGALRDALSIFDRVVSFSNDNITRQAVAENLNVLDYDSYFKITDLILENNIPQVLISFNEILAKGFEGHHFIAGLASHFRDLLVAKDSVTIPLLEVGDATKKQYDEQSKKCEVSFLLKGIDLANDCDLKYKSSKNQRLLVELTLMQLASITFPNTDEKKKRKNYIIPAIHFISTAKTKEKKVVKKQIPTSPALETTSKEIKKTRIEQKPTTEKPVLTTRTNRRSSALSLNSVHKKKSTSKKLSDEVEDNTNKPKDDFTEIQFLELWQNQIKKLEKKGVKNLVAILNADLPKVKDNKIYLTMPSGMMKTELLKAKPKLLRHFREKLNNYSIDFVIKVNEENQKKYVYTPQEKYNKLLEKNKALAKLKSKFKLDL
ncbi:DNA polymerase III subunit gamma/tau [Aureibaculum sp. 2210JD6-5]|uniref:DNA polymerase III subunit gamma/tau n=1 Tax=Aureibaculum sp. 2210JD6-5 TaxID=3103957 RepID=UPI002AAEE175|nr:DNA polymerase III subunit gamma/tau [Aureibaculum sp. 2210JD6-5]MDY7395142.1 DNA polymerase III subunit gamma/tau [Aureibaculum sp. 2210JD6-5]